MEPPKKPSKRGSCENRNTFWRLNSGYLKKDLIFRNLNLGPWYTHELVSKNNVGIDGFYGICFISSLREQYKDTHFQVVLAIAEVIMPNIPDEMVLTEEEAREEFVSTIKDNWLKIINNYGGGFYIQCRIEDFEGYFQNYLDTQTPNLEILSPDLTLFQAMCLLKIIIKGTDELQKELWCFWIVLAMIVCIKRGRVDKEWLKNIKNKMFPALHTTEFNCNPHSMYAVFKLYVTDKNAEEVFKRWASLLPPESLCLKELLLQTEGTGLIALETIIRAIRDFQDFPWMRIQDLFPTEFLNFLTAVKAVNGNRYYGFKCDLGPADGSLYSNLAWVAKTLEVSINKDVSLNDCEDWQPDQHVNNHDILVKMINAYEKLRLSSETTEPLDQKELLFAADLVQKIECYGPLN